MKELRISSGLDMSKDDMKACICSIDGAQKTSILASKTFPNTPKGHQECLSWANKSAKGAPVRFTMEATGVYHEQMAWFLYDQGQEVSVVLPNKVKKYLQCLGQRSKNDTMDAKGIALMGAQQNLPLWAPISKGLYQLRALTRHLQSLQEAHTGLNNRLLASRHGMYRSPEVEKSLAATLKALDKQIKGLKKSIATHMAKDTVLSGKLPFLTSIKGVAGLTAAIVIAETDGFELFTSQKQLASYAGYDVVENQSGKKTGKSRMSKKGNAHIRRAMHLPAFNVVRYKVGPFYGLYLRVYEKTKCKMKAYVAVQRKLLGMLFTLWQKEEPFLPGGPKKPSGDQEAAALFPVAPAGGALAGGDNGATEKTCGGVERDEKKVATHGVATQDGHPFDQSAGVLFPVLQI